MDGQRASSVQVAWRSIVDTAMDGIICIDQCQQIILFNGAAERIFGYTAGAVMGMHINMLIPERFREVHRSLVEQFGNKPVRYRQIGTERAVLALRSDGTEFPVQASISHFDEDGKKIYTVFLRDVTESVESRILIQRQQDMLDHVSDAIYAIDLHDRITYWNHAAEKIFGWTATEALGSQAMELLDRYKPVQAEKFDSNPSRFGKLLKVTREGQSIVVEHYQMQSTDETGRVHGYLCIARDVTNRRKQEQEERRNQRLESIGTLAGGIAHDLNNLLSPILMGAKLLKSGRPVNQHGILETMVASAERGAGLIRQLLTFAGGVRGTRNSLQFNELIEETRNFLEHTFPKSIQIETSVSQLLPVVTGDATELSQVLMNLCINARDAMPHGGVLRIEAEPIELNETTKFHPDASPGRYVLIKVVDTGEGMSPEVMESIFNPFFTTKEIGRGTGLGLATVQGIVKSHDGFVTVYSERGRGSTFCVYLPVSSDTNSPPILDELQTAERPGTGRTILVVDDEAPIRQMTGLALEAAGYRVLLAANGMEALRTFREHHSTISAVILDMMMPDIDGLQVGDGLHQIDPKVPVIMCSGLQTSKREATVMEHGASAFVAKPYSDETILNTLANVLSQSSSREQSTE